VKSSSFYLKNKYRLQKILNFTKRLILSIKTFLMKSNIKTGAKFSEKILLLKKCNVHSYNTICLFSHFSKNGQIDEYVIYYIEKLAKFTDIIFVSTAENMTSKEIDKISKFCLNVLVKENTGYDFGAWKSGLTLLNKQINNYEHLILCNDSVYGPFTQLEAIFNRMNKNYDVWSMTDNYEIKYHLQSYFMVYSKKAIKHKIFQRHFNDFKIYNTKLDIILKNEVIFSNSLYNSNLNVGTYISSNEFSKNNPCHIHWKELLIQKKFPFIKKELLRDNPRALNISDWEEVIESISNYDTSIIKKNLK
jgi:O-antigen biosynthesis protein